MAILVGVPVLGWVYGALKAEMKARWRRAHPHVVVMCAVEEEATYLRQVLQDAKELPRLAGIFRQTRGYLKGVKVDLIICLIGGVHAAAATAALLSSLQAQDLPLPDCIFNCGCSGAHVPYLKCGDVVIATGVVPLDSHQLLPDGSRRYSGFRETVEKPHVASLAIKPSLVDFVRTVAAETLLPSWPGGATPQVYEGLVGSTDVWTQQTDALRLIHASTQTLCEEMEAANIAWVCRGFGVPFVAIKDISNNELATHTVEDGGTGQGLRLDQIGLRAAMVTASGISMWGMKSRSES